MKHLLLFALMSFGIINASAQKALKKIVVNPLIFEFYPATKVEIMLSDNPQEIVFWNAIYDFGYEIKDVIKSQKDLVNKYQEIEIENFDKVNVLGMNLFPMKGKNQYFKIKDTNKILTLFSEEVIRQQLTKEK
ncbi:MAG: hypothetical protein ACI8ZX_001258 [Planctomycetota bacterium]|jgi:hypothetical protein